MVIVLFIILEIQLIILLYHLPMVNVDKLVNVSCYGSSDGFIMLDILGTAYPFTFSWTGPNGFTSNSMDIYNLSPGFYEATVTDNNGNITIEDFVITEPSQLNVNIIIRS